MSGPTQSRSRAGLGYPAAEVLAMSLAVNGIFSGLNRFVVNPVAESLLDGEFGQENLLHERSAENVVEARDQFRADQVA